MGYSLHSSTGCRTGWVCWFCWEEVGAPLQAKAHFSVYLAGPALDPHLPPVPTLTRGYRASLQLLWGQSLTSSGESLNRAALLKLAVCVSRCNQDNWDGDHLTDLTCIPQSTSPWGFWFTWLTKPTRPRLGKAAGLCVGRPDFILVLTVSTQVVVAISWPPPEMHGHFSAHVMFPAQFDTSLEINYLPLMWVQALFGASASFTGTAFRWHVM